jgi:hypothetical protein
MRTRARPILGTREGHLMPARQGAARKRRALHPARPAHVSQRELRTAGRSAAGCAWPPRSARHGVANWHPRRVLGLVRAALPKLLRDAARRTMGSARALRRCAPCERCGRRAPGSGDKGEKRSAAGAQVLHDRLAALEMMLLQKPIVSGRYSNCTHRRFMLPLRPYYDHCIARRAPASPRQPSPWRRCRRGMRAWPHLAPRGTSLISRLND